MKNTFFPITQAKIFLFLIASFFLANKALAEKIDNFSFCLNICTTTQCGTNAAIKSDCKKRCSNDWQQIANLELSKNNKEFRTTKDEKKKNMMLFSSEIAKCLDMNKIEIPVEKALPQTDEKDKITKPNEAKPISKDELCAAAIRQEMTALKNEQTALKAQEGNMAAALEAINK
ncbi:MAG: hypothetical protein FJX03_01730 [Alphaproteobacteria bacterium]|nr:hypothetical protein [Alphaproteobacteria bacterium]